MILIDDPIITGLLVCCFLLAVLQLLVLQRMIDMWARNRAIFSEVIENVSGQLHLYHAEDDIITPAMFFI